MNLDEVPGLLPTFPEDPGNVIQDFSCNPGSAQHDNSIIMKLGDALQLCNDKEYNTGLIGQEISTEHQPGFMADIEKARMER